MTDIYDTFNAVVHNPNDLVALDSLRLSVAVRLASGMLAAEGPELYYANGLTERAFYMADALLAKAGVHDPRKEEA